MMHPRIAWLLDRVRGSRILDVGYARKQDVLLRVFRERNPQATVVGIDLDMETVLAMRDQHTLVGNALRLPFQDNQFDTVIAGELLEHVWDGFGLLSELARVSRPGGAVYVTTPNPFSLNNWLRHWLLAPCVYNRAAFQGFLGNADHKMFWNPPSLFNAMDELGLEIVEATTIGIRIPFLARLVNRLGSLHVPWFPLNRLGFYLCIATRKGGDR
jgi:SAM-dependent methyltransferase